MSYTLFRSLTHLENPVFPATESIRQLIETIARDVVRFRRNTQISYHFVDRARSVCDIINALIQRVDEEDDWDSYDKFTEAIDLLEECVHPASRDMDPDLFPGFCSTRQQPPKMRCSVTLEGIMTSMDVSRPQQPGRATEKGFEDVYTLFAQSQSLECASVVLSVAANLSSIRNCYPWQMTKKQRLLKQENMTMHHFFSSYTSRLKAIPFDKGQQGPFSPPPTWTIDNVHL